MVYRYERTEPWRDMQQRNEPQLDEKEERHRISVHEADHVVFLQTIPNCQYDYVTLTPIHGRDEGLMLGHVYLSKPPKNKWGCPRFC